MAERLRGRGIRTRQVNIRFTDDEFERLRAACVISGLGSVSEFARSAVFRTIGLVTGGPQNPGDPVRWAELYQRSITRLEAACQQLEERLGQLDRNEVPAGPG